MSDLDSFAFEPGQQVKCKTRFEDVYKGEVMAFDLNSKVLIIKSPSSAGNASNNDLHFLVLDSVADVEIIEEVKANANVSTLSNLDMRHLEERKRNVKSERLKLLKAGPAKMK